MIGKMDIAGIPTSGGCDGFLIRKVISFVVDWIIWHIWVCLKIGVPKKTGGLSLVSSSKLSVLRVSHNYKLYWESSGCMLPTNWEIDGSQKNRGNHVKMQTIGDLNLHL